MNKIKNIVLTKRFLAFAVVTGASLAFILMQRKAPVELEGTAVGDPAVGL